MNKIDEYDARKLIKAKNIISEVSDYNYTSDSSPVCRKLNTIIAKIDRLLETELEPEIQEEYRRKYELIREKKTRKAETTVEVEVPQEVYERQQRNLDRGTEPDKIKEEPEADDIER